MTTSGKTTYFQNMFINFIRSTLNIYVALYTDMSDPEDGIGTEVVGGGYARILMTFKAPVDGITTNNEIVFSIATGNWTGPITHFALFDSIAGNMIYYGMLKASKTILIDDTPQILEDTLTLQES